VTGSVHFCFAEALDKVADRLVGPYNIEIVVQPLNIKISEAIMNFQESGTEVSNKIYTLCGKPTLNRRKRRADGKDAVEENPSYEIKYTPMKKMNGHKKKKTKKYEEEDEGPTLERLIKEIKMVRMFRSRIGAPDGAQNSVHDYKSVTALCLFDRVKPKFKILSKNYAGLLILNSETHVGPCGSCVRSVKVNSVIASCRDSGWCGAAIGLVFSLCLFLSVC
jgi:hypothetical protein